MEGIKAGRETITALGKNNKKMEELVVTAKRLEKWAYYRKLTISLSLIIRVVARKNLCKQACNSELGKLKQ